MHRLHNSANRLELGVSYNKNTKPRSAYYYVHGSWLCREVAFAFAVVQHKNKIVICHNQKVTLGSLSPKMELLHQK